jgi:Ca2+-transporting ATPase
MKVTDIIGSDIDIGKQAIIANDLDDPLVVASWEWANKKLSNKDLGGENVDAYLDEHGRLDSIPFSSKTRYFASLNLTTKGPTLFVNGAPEFLLEWTNLDKSEKLEIQKTIEDLTTQGKRLIGLAKKRMPKSTKKIKETDVKGDLDWVGLVAFSDPVRSGVKEALEKVKETKVKLIVITGDYAQTAVSVLENLNLSIGEENEILGSELEKMSVAALRKRPETNETLLFARTTPSQKLKIVTALKENNEVVAMMGDGVNDAPALKHADIGIVVGDATDVAKESADLVLLDSSFATIVSAIEEGRGIYDNLRKIILYLMSDAFEEIVAVVGSIILGLVLQDMLPLPVTAAQILWINLVSDGFPHLALTVDPKNSGIMNSLPRNPREPLVASWMKKLILIVSLWGGLTGLTLFIYFYQTTGNVILAQSVAFATLGVNSLIYVFSVRTLRDPVWIENPLENGWLNIAVLAGVALQVFPFLFASTRDFLELYPLELDKWIIIFAASAFMFIMIEIMKFIFRGRLNSQSNYY